MSGELTVSLSSERLASGSAEERATFGLFSVAANGHPLTAGEDIERKELRYGPHVSGYPIAEWIAWNWWRLRWEVGRPRSTDENAVSRWDFAHRMSAIGEGYAWPNVTIYSDGLQSFLTSESSGSPETALFRYMGAKRQAVPTGSLEAAFDGFLKDILGRLEAEDVRETNLHRLWSDLKEERSKPDIARFRRLEAQLGYEPGEADEAAIRRRLDDAAKLGEKALGELAADATLDTDALDGMMRASDISDIAKREGFEANPDDAIKLGDVTGMPQLGREEAWRVGEFCAKRIRDQENLDGQLISDKQLVEFAGSMRDAISEKNGQSPKISFALAGEDARALVYLSSKMETGRRFDLARLIGDLVFQNQLVQSGEPLFPVTRAYSYRQKMQRAFAAELLSPFASVDEMMAEDYSSDEKRHETAKRFRVSEWVVQTQLLNKRRIDRRDAPDVAERSPVHEKGRTARESNQEK